MVRQRSEVWGGEASKFTSLTRRGVPTDLHTPSRKKDLLPCTEVRSIMSPPSPQFLLTRNSRQKSPNVVLSAAAGQYSSLPWRRRQHLSMSPSSVYNVPAYNSNDLRCSIPANLPLALASRSLRENRPVYFISALHHWVMVARG